MSNVSSHGTALLDVLVAVSATLQTATTSKAGIIDAVRAHLVEYEGQSVLLLLDEDGTQANVHIVTSSDTDSFTFDGTNVEGRTFPLAAVPALQQTVHEGQAQFFSQRNLLVNEMMPAVAGMPGAGAPNDPRPTICAPLLVENEVYGIIGIAAHGLTSDDVSVVESLANCIALAFTHLRHISTVRESGECYPVDQATDGVFVAKRDGTDVTAHRQTEVVLERHDDILKAAAVAATQFLREENWRANVEEVLAQLGEAAQVSRVYIFENHIDADGTLLTSYRFEWVAPGITPQLDDPNLQNLPYDAAGFKRWRETLSTGDLIHGSVSTFPSNERELLQAQDIVSIVVVPIFADGEWWGFMGFDECERERDWSPAQFDALRTAANTLGAAIHHERTELAIQQYTERLRALRDIEQAILDAQTAEDIATAALNRLRRLLGYPRASVAMIENKSKDVNIVAVSAEKTSTRPSKRRILRDAFWDPIEMEALRQGRIHVTADIEQAEHSSEFLQILRAEGVRAFLSIPLLAHGTLIGTLNVGTLTTGPFDDTNVEIMREIADSLAVALYQARLVEELTTELHLTETLREVSALVTSELGLDEVLETILDFVGRVVDYDSASILRVKDDGGVELAVGRGLPDISRVREAVPALGDELRRLIPTEEVTLLRDTRSERRWTEVPGSGTIRSWVGAPLTVKGHLIGTLNVDSRTPNAYDESTAETVMTFANQAAIAIENARLFSETKLALSREHQLTEITRTLSSTLDLTTVLKNVVRRAAELIGADAGTLALVSSDGQRMTYPYLYNLPEHLVDREAPRGEGMAWHVVETGTSVLRSEYAASPHALTNWVDAGVHSVLAVPLTTGNSRIGVLGLFNLTRGEQFSERDLVLAEAIGRQAGVAIRNARLHQQTERRAQRLAVLHQIDTTIATGGDLRLTLNAILQQVTAQLNVDAAAISLKKASANTLEYAAGQGFRTDVLQNTRLHLGGGYADRAIRERRPVFIEDLREETDHLDQAPLVPDEDFVSYHAMPLLVKGEVKGVLEFFYRRRVVPDPEWHQFMRTLAGQAAISIENAQLFANLQRSNAELAMAYDATLAGWARALELRDVETEGHSQRVTKLTVRLARDMGVPEKEIEHIRRGARLHDIGKMGISDSILLKPGPLSVEEWELMRLHPVYAYEMLASIDFLAPALDIPRYHHEKWDGSGYPDGLKGEQIPLAARIFAVVDVYDALISVRPYRDAWSEEDALAHIREQSGVHFDPDVVKAFLQLIEEYQ